MPDRLREVLWSEAAEKDLAAIVDFIFQDSPAAAARIWRDIKTSGEGLSRFPLKGRVPPELKEIGLDAYREAVVFPYRILYRVREKTVYVLGVFDGRRDMEEILFERLTRPTA